MKQVLQAIDKYKELTKLDQEVQQKEKQMAVLFQEMAELMANRRKYQICG